MKLANSELIKQIDSYAESKLNIPTVRLMELAGAAVAKEARSLTAKGDGIIILAGKGNNGGDGYAAASLLSSDRTVTVFDVFSAGQRSSAGKHFLDACISSNVKILSGVEMLEKLLPNATLVIDAIFGTGYSGELSSELRWVADLVNSSEKTVLAVDLPLGVSSDSATVCEGAIRADRTVALTLYKPAHLCYPAKEFMGALSLDTLALDGYLDRFEFSTLAVDEPLFKELFPKRGITQNKGSFGKTVHITGSEKYRGAAHLALEAALRSGVGIACHSGGGELASELRMKYPEAIYIDKIKPVADCDPVFSAFGKYSSVLLGSGSGISRELASLAENIIQSEGAPLVLDADGINSIAEYSSPEIFLLARRKVILTPHPLEFARLSGKTVEFINANRLPVAVEFAKRYGVILLLKGAATVITDGERVYVNTSGSTALAKGGSGDVLAGLISSVIAYSDDCLGAVAACAYLHGRAGDTLSAELSDYGVTPSDLPAEIARHIKFIIG